MTVLIVCNAVSLKKFFVVLFGLFYAFSSMAVEPAHVVELSNQWVGYAVLLIFIIAYIFVILEEKIHLSKSKPVLLAAGLIWIIIAGTQLETNNAHDIEQAIRYDFLEYAELFFFLLVAMTYINAIAERGVFKALRDWLIFKGFSYRQLFWLTGFLAFFISPLADNLTTALIMCAVILAVGQNNSKFISLGCINVVIAANAGGAFSPFGDITTLMVWQSGMVAFEDFFKLFIPSLVNYLLPALIMSFSISKTRPTSTNNAHIHFIKPGGVVMVVMFLATIVTAVSFHTWLNLPPVYGMMFGLGYLKLYAYLLRMKVRRQLLKGLNNDQHDCCDDFDIFDMIAKSEWDTLFFFYGVIMCVGGLGYIGYLAFASECCLQLSTTFPLCLPF